MSDFIAQIQAEVDLSSAEKQMQSFLTKYKNDSLSINVELNDSAGKNLDISKQFNNIGRQASQSFSKGFSSVKFNSPIDYAKLQKENQKKINSIAQQMGNEVPAPSSDLKKWATSYTKEQDKVYKQFNSELKKQKDRLASSLQKNDYADRTDASNYLKKLDTIKITDYDKPLQKMESINKEVSSYITNLEQSHKSNLNQINAQIKEQERMQSIRSKEYQSYNNPYREAYQSIGKRDPVFDDMKQYYEEQDKVYKQIADIQNRASSGEFELRNAQNETFLSKYLGQDTETLQRAKIQIEEIKSLQTELSTGKYLNGDSKGIDIIPEDQITKVGQLDEKISQLSNTMKQVRLESSATLGDGVAERSANKVASYMEANTKALKKYGNELKELEQQYRNINTEGEKLQLDNKFRNLQAKISADGLTGKSWLSDFGRAVKQIGQFAGVYGMIQNVAFEVPTKMITAVQDVNKAQIELTKVSDAPLSQLSDYWDEAAESAKKYGSTISDAINSTADWSRLGYSLNESKKLSDATLLMEKIGDNMTQESSSKGIISTLQGFKLQANEVGKIVDVVNEVANTEPIDTSGIFDALSKSASSMSAARNTLEESVALITAAKYYWLNVQKCA